LKSALLNHQKALLILLLLLLEIWLLLEFLENVLYPERRKFHLKKKRKKDRNIAEDKKETSGAARNRSLRMELM
jgi:hypothetical protein